LPGLSKFESQTGFSSFAPWRQCTFGVSPNHVGGRLNLLSLKSQTAPPRGPCDRKGGGLNFCRCACGRAPQLPRARHIDWARSKSGGHFDAIEPIGRGAAQPTCVGRKSKRSGRGRTPMRTREALGATRAERGEVSSAGGKDRQSTIEPGMPDPSCPIRRCVRAGAGQLDDRVKPLDSPLDCLDSLSAWFTVDRIRSAW